VSFRLRCLLVRLQLCVGRVRLVQQHHLAHLEVGVAGVEDLHFIDNLAVDHATIWALDKAVVVDAREAG
jgi:hypothetical protein